jgi:hypothetical protein
MGPLDKAYSIVEVNSDKQFKILQLLLSIVVCVAILVVLVLTYLKQLTSAILLSLIIISAILVKIYMLLLRQQFKK